MASSYIQNIRNYAQAMALRGASWQDIMSRSGVNQRRAQEYDSMYDKGSFLEGTLEQGRKEYEGIGVLNKVRPSEKWLTNMSEKFARDLTKQFIKQYTSDDFIASLRINQEPVQQQQPTRQPRPQPIRFEMPELPRVRPPRPPRRGDRAPATAAPAAPVQVMPEEAFSGGAPQDINRRGRVRRGRSARPAAQTRSNSLSALSIGGGGAAGRGLTIGGPQLSL
jgi:hypothetical protein